MSPDYFAYMSKSIQEVKTSFMKEEILHIEVYRSLISLGISTQESIVKLKIWVDIRFQNKEKIC